MSTLCKAPLSVRATRVTKAKTDYKAAAEHLMAVIRAEYPIGDVVDVELGNAIVTVEITRHTDSWWHRPTEVTGVNIHTGKTRRFTPEQIVEF